MQDYFSSGDEYCYHDYYDDDDDDRDASYGLQEIETEVPLPCTKGPSCEVIECEHFKRFFF
jgi:hypothetical protein